MSGGMECGIYNNELKELKNLSDVTQFYTFYYKIDDENKMKELIKKYYIEATDDEFDKWVNKFKANGSADLGKVNARSTQFIRDVTMINEIKSEEKKAPAAANSISEAAEQQK